MPREYPAAAESDAAGQIEIEIKDNLRATHAKACVIPFCAEDRRGCEWLLLEDVAHLRSRGTAEG
jgi:hypothetical protein